MLLPLLLLLLLLLLLCSASKFCLTLRQFREKSCKGLRSDRMLEPCTDATVREQQPAPQTSLDQSQPRHPPVRECLHKRGVTCTCAALRKLICIFG
jgi:hypothetical protein